MRKTNNTAMCFAGLSAKFKTFFGSRKLQIAHPELFAIQKERKNRPRGPQFRSVFLLSETPEYIHYVTQWNPAELFVVWVTSSSVSQQQPTYPPIKRKNLP